LALLIFL